MRQQVIYQASAGISTVRYQPASNLLLCGTYDGRVIGLDAQNEFQVVHEFSTGLTAIDGLDVHAHEPIIAVAGQGTHQAWHLPTKQRLFSESFPPFDQSPPGYGSGFCLCFHHSLQPSDWVLFGSYSANFIAHNWRTGERRELCVGSDYNVWLAFHPAGDIGCASCLHPQSHSKIGYFDFRSSGEMSAYHKPYILFDEADVNTDYPVRCTFTPDGSHLLTSGTNTYLTQTEAEVSHSGGLLGTVNVYNFPDSQLIHEIKIRGELHDMAETMTFNGTEYCAEGSISNVAALAGGHCAVCGTQSGQLVLVDCVAGVVVETVSLSTNCVTSVDTINAVTIAVAGEDGTVILCGLSEQIVTLQQASSKEVAQSSARQFFSQATPGRF